ncbi:MAG TPA: DUF3488 and transglutaminase-like domain-containing protein [Chthoniobacter sp.]|jgi:transglutaminase-like putative cysteine protease
MSLFRQSGRYSDVATAPLLGLILVLVLSIIPLAEKITDWVLVGFFGICAVRLFLNRPGVRLPSLPVKLVLFAGGIGGVILTYGSPVGIEPGFSILAVLVSLKLIEANGARDFHVLALLGFFLALCDLFTEQDLTRWMYVGVIFLLLLATLVHFHRGQESPSYGRSTVLAGTLLVQALPIALILFLFFPRVYGGFRFQFSQSLLYGNGMSDRLSPGSISSLALSDQVVFRADFPSGGMPPISEMYWRGGVLWQGDGMTWTKGRALLREFRPRQFAGPMIYQRISLQPHGEHWMFALDHPASAVRGAEYVAGNILRSEHAITSRLRYEVTSQPEDHEIILPADQRVATTALPAHVPPRVKELVDGWKARNPDPKAILNAAREYFRDQPFVYTVNPGTYDDPRALEEFLFVRREGFCEHYAAAFATLMRVAGVPSRVVIGYQGGDYNSLGKYVIVRQAHSHAWCEIWLKGEGWQRVDPTGLIAPDRITSTLNSYLEARGGQGDDGSAGQRAGSAKGWHRLEHQLQLAWDSVNYQWDLRVLNFDQEAQRSFLFSLGLGSTSWTEIFIWLLVATAGFVAGLSLWLRKPGTAVDKVGRGYARFCSALARAGIAREPWEGPQDFSRRAAQRFPAQAEIIQRISDRYIELRYSAAPANPQPFLDEVRHLPRFTATASSS